MQFKKKRILAVFSDVDFSPQLLEIVRNLLERGAIVRVVLIGNKDLQIVKQMGDLECELKRISQRGKVGSIYNLFSLAQEVIRFRPQTLFASGQFATVIGMLSAKLLNVPQRVFIRHHSNFHHKYKMKFGTIVDRVMNRFATSIVAVSMIVKNILVQVESVNQEKITVIHNGINLTRFKRKQILSKAASTQSTSNSKLFHIGVVSRLTEWKGVEYTAKAFVKLQKEFPNSHLHLVGAFADSYSAIKLILSDVASDNYSIEMRHSNIPLFIHGLDAFVHVPIGTEDEAFGIVYIEALAVGIPCVFTQSGILNELDAPDQYAHMVTFRDSEDIYINLKRLIQGKSDSKVKVPESWLNQFSINNMAKRYSELLLRESH